MDNNQTVSNPVPAPSVAPNVLSGKIPSSVTFIVAVLLFVMPFIDIKCNNMSLQQVTGLQLATGFKMKDTDSKNNWLDDDKKEETTTKTKDKSSDKDPNIYAIAALALGILGLGLSFTNAKAAIGGAMVTGILSAGALIGLMIDIKQKVKLDMGSKDTKTTTTDSLSNGLDNFGKELTDKLNISVDFTPWFYIAVVAFLAAAFFCYKRMSSMKS